MRRSILCLILAGGLSVADLWSPSGLLPGPSPALADDDDDGGDDDGDDGGSPGWGDDDARPGRGIGLPRFLRSLDERLRPGRARAPRRAQPAPEHARDEIVAFGLAAAEIDQLVAQGFAVRSRQVLGSLGGEVVKLVPASGLGLDAARDAVKLVAPAAPVDFNHYYDPSAALPCGGKPCVAPSLVGWPAQPGNGGSCAVPDAVIGLVDTSINVEHETFRSSRIEVHRLDPDAHDASGQQHGTAVASLLVGTGPNGTPGLLPGARLVAVDAFKANDRADAYDLVRAIDRLVAEDAGVINMSISGPDNALLAKAVELVASNGIDIVAAAGNEGPGGDPVYPAAYERVIAVTAVDRSKRIYRRANHGDYIDLAAPGVEVWVAASIKGTRPKTGTSFAAPFVTAAVVLARAGEPGRDGAAVLLAQRAEDLGDPGKDPVFGSGLLNARGLCG